ncbi:MAG: FecR family protein [Chitinophagaceae bacterium]
MQPDWNTLLNKYLNDQLTPAELSRFLELARAAEGEEQLKAAVEAALSDGTFSGLSDEKRADALFQAVIRNAEVSAQQKPGIIVRLFRKRMAVAAVLLAVVGLAAFFLWPAANEGDFIAEVRKQVVPGDVLPGGDKATLTLEDGTVIVLDTAANGMLMAAGKQVRKSSSGELLYTSVGDTEATPAMHTLSTPRGGQFRLVLPDGSIVFLNAASSVTFPSFFTGNTREVAVTGEAYFEVAQKMAGTQKIPFTVNVRSAAGKEKARVEVLGTHFNIMGYDDEAQMVTTLLEGAVKVVSAGSNETRLLAPGKQSVLNPETGTQRVSDANEEQAVAWKNGYFYYERADVRTIMRQLERWYNIAVEYKSIPSKKFSGTLPRKEKVSKVLEMLELTGNVTFKIEGDKVIVNN